MPEVNAYIEQGNRVLGALGLPEHSRGTCSKSGGNCRKYSGKIRSIISIRSSFARIAGYMHDMGNL